MPFFQNDDSTTACGVQMVDCLDASNMNFFLNVLKYQTPNVGHLSFEEYLNDSEMDFLHNHLPVASHH